MRTFYSSFIGHCIKFYCKYPKINKFKSNADKLNWYAVHRAFERIPDEKKEIIMEVFSSSADVNSGIRNVAHQKDIGVSSLWKIVSDFENAVAIARGII